MKIAQIAPLWISVPPKGYGGAEQVISLITEELVKRKHEVMLFASSDSQTKAKLISPVEKKAPGISIEARLNEDNFMYNLMNSNKFYNKIKIHKFYLKILLYTL